MNIIIIGAGEIGRYIASILSKEQHNIVLVDKDGKKLEQAASAMDIAIRQGSGTDWQLLKDLLELSPDFFIALTHDDETNLVACSMAKHLGYPKAISRIKDEGYLNSSFLNFGQIFNVDYFLGLESLVAHDILKHILNPCSLMIENFASGAVQLMMVRIPEGWKRSSIPLRNLSLPQGMICGFIKRMDFSGNEQFIFPHGEDCIFPGDEVTLIGETDVVAQSLEFFGLKHKKISSVVIAGGSLTGLNIARLLAQRNIDVRIIEKDYERCAFLSEQLPLCTILHRDATDIEFLRSENVGSCDVLLACTSNDETNFMIGLLGREMGCKEIVIILTNLGYAPLISRLGINYTASPRVSAANHILSQILNGIVCSLVSLYDNQAEIMEVNVSRESKMAGIPLSELGPLLPKNFLIAMIQNKGRIMIARGDCVVSPGDTVIVLTDPKHISYLKKMF